MSFNAKHPNVLNQRILTVDHIVMKYTIYSDQYLKQGFPIHTLTEYVPEQFFMLANSTIT